MEFVLAPTFMDVLRDSDTEQLSLSHLNKSLSSLASRRCGEGPTNWDQTEKKKCSLLGMASMVSPELPIKEINAGRAETIIKG